MTYSVLVSPLKRGSVQLLGQSIRLRAVKLHLRRVGMTKSPSTAFSAVLSKPPVRWPLDLFGRGIPAMRGRGQFPGQPIRLRAAKLHLRRVGDQVTFNGFFSRTLSKPPVRWNLQFLGQSIRLRAAKLHLRRVAMTKSPSTAFSAVLSKPPVRWNLQFLGQSIRLRAAKLHLRRVGMTKSPSTAFSAVLSKPPVRWPLDLFGRGIPAMRGRGQFLGQPIRLRAAKLHLRRVGMTKSPSTAFSAVFSKPPVRWSHRPTRSFLSQSHLFGRNLQPAWHKFGPVISYSGLF